MSKQTDNARPNASHEKEADRLLSAADAAAKEDKTLYRAFLGVTLGLAAAVGFMSDLQLLLGGSVPFPGTDFTLKTVPFFAVVPLFYVMFHGYLLLQLSLLSRKLADFDREVESLPVPQDKKDRKRRMICPFLFSQVKLRTAQSDTNAMLVVALWATLGVVPVALLCWTQRQFLPDHDEAVTWLHRLYVLLDLALLWRFRHVFQPLTTEASIDAVSQQEVSGARRRVGVRTVVIVHWIRRFAKRVWTTAGLATLLVAFVSIFILTVPDERVDCIVTRLNSKFVERILHRNLIVRNKILVSGLELPDGLDARHKINEEVENALEHTKGLDLTKRDLRYADFSGSVLFNAEFQGSNLEHAKFVGADLRGATFVDSKFPKINLKAADLSGAWLQGVNLREAHLQAANFTGAQLQGAILKDAFLSGADLSSAVLDGASLVRTMLYGAILSNAQFRGTNLEGAKLNGATMVGANFHGSSLRLARTGGKSLLKGARVTLCDLRDLKYGRPVPGDLTDALSAIREYLPEGRWQKQAIERLRISDLTPALPDGCTKTFLHNLYDEDRYNEEGAPAGKGPCTICCDSAADCNNVPPSELAKPTCQNRWLAKGITEVTILASQRSRTWATELAKALKESSKDCSAWDGLSNEISQLDELIARAPAP